VELWLAFEEGSEHGFDFRVTLPAIPRSICRGLPDAHAQHCLSAQFYERRNASRLRFDDAKHSLFHDPYEL
jgi:hypothetical protein